MRDFFMYMISKNVLTISEVFERVKKCTTNEEKIQLLKLYDTPALKWYVNGIYNRDWSSIKIPKYKESKRPYGTDYLSIKSAIKKIELVLNGKIKSPELQMLDILENMHKEESALLIGMFNNDEIEGIPESVLKKVYPDFFL